MTVAAALGCGQDPTPPATIQGCPSASVTRPDGSCVPVGIQGCADIFMEDDGLCHPSMDKCPAGTIPKFDEGCVPVGIQGCAEIFMEDDGLCHPSTDKCPAGTIPKFDEGCVPVGIQGCAEIFMEDDGLCHPSMDKCPAGTFAVPRQGCVPIDGPAGCGSGTWGDLQDIAGVTTIWVDPSAAVSGDGAMVSPVMTIAEALALVPAGGRVALGAGTYDEPIDVTKAVTIEGRCPSMVRVQGTAMDGTNAFVVRVGSADNVTLRRLEIGGPGIGVLASDAAGLTIEGAHVRNATSVALYLEGSTTVASIVGSYIEGTLAVGDGSGGRGVDAAYGARATFDECAFSANHEIGVFAIDPGTEVSLTDSIVQGTLPQASNLRRGRGIDVEGGATLTLTDSAVVRNHENGAIAFGHDTALVLANSLVEDTRPSEANAQLGEGVVAVDGAGLTLSRSAIIRNRRLGVVTQGSGTRATVTGTLVNGTLPQQSDGSVGSGIVVLGARLELSESSIIDNHRVGLVAAGAGSEVAATGNLIESQGSRGVYVYDDAIATLDGNAISGNSAAGITVEDPATDVMVTGSLVAGTLSQPDDGRSGRGVDVINGAHVTLQANAIVANRDMGIAVQVAGAEIVASGNLIAGTQPRESDNAYGRGASVERGATLILEGNAIVENHEVGVHAADSETALTATRNLVEGTLPQRSDDLLGRGVGVELGAQATLEANAILANHDTGIFVSGSAATMTGNIIEGTLPRVSDGQLGMGVVSADLAAVQLVSSILYDNRVSALLVTNATASVSHSLIETVSGGSFSLQSPSGTFDGIGDGLLATVGATLDVSDTRVRGCARAGVLFADSSGTLSGVVSTENQLGLVLQGQRRPSYEDGNNQLTGNTGQDVLTSGDLPAPDATSLTPPP